MSIVPRLTEPGLMTPEELQEIERIWDRFTHVARLIAHIRVLHYRYEALKAWAQTIDREAFLAYQAKVTGEEEQ